MNELSSASRAMVARPSLEDASRTAQRSGVAGAAEIDKTSKAWAVAKEFETTFIAEMLKQAKLGDVGGSFSGGYGAATYRSFLVDEYAKTATAQQSFGLAEALYAQISSQGEFSSDKNASEAGK